MNGWLTRTRIRRQALLLAVALWLGYAFTIATPGLRDRFGHLKGADFLHFYTLGSLALEHRGAALYDPVAQVALSAERVPQSAGDFFLPMYAPHYSLLCAPFALLPYGPAAALWMLLSALLYGLCVWSVWRCCAHLQRHGGTVLLAALAYPAFFALVTFGQNSALALAAFTGMYFALRSDQRFLAGVCIGLLAYKPQLGIVAAVVFIAAMEWRVVAGAVSVLIAQFAAAWAYYGTAPLLAYLHALRNLNTASAILEPKLYLMHSLRAFWDLLLPWRGLSLALYAVSAVLVIVTALPFWRSSRTLELRCAALLLATVLVAPHLTIYDLVILAPAWLWLADAVAAAALAPPARLHAVGWLLYLGVLLPVLGPVARWTHVQLSVPVLVVLLLVIRRSQASIAEPATASFAGRGN